MFRSLHACCRSRDAVAEFHTSCQNTVIFSGSDCIDCLLDRQISGTACFGMVDRSFSFHTEPVSDLDVRSQIVGSVQRTCLSMEIKIHILRIYSCIFHRFERGISEQFSLCQTVRLRIVHCIHKRSTADTDDGNASLILA